MRTQIGNTSCPVYCNWVKPQLSCLCFCSLKSLTEFFQLVVGFITYKTSNQLVQKRNKASPSHPEDLPHTWRHDKSSFESLEWVAVASNHWFSTCKLCIYYDLGQVPGTRDIAVNKAKWLSLFRSQPTEDHRLSNSMKLWAMPCRATQDGWDMVESSDKNVVHWRREWQTTSVLLPWDMKRQKDMTLKNKPSPQKKKDKLPRSVGTLCYWRRVEK